MAGGLIPGLSQTAMWNGHLARFSTGYDLALRPKAKVLI